MLKNQFPPNILYPHIKICIQQVTLYIELRVCCCYFQCSASCGTGTKTREVRCMDPELAPSSTCTANKKPSQQNICNTQPCTDESVQQGMTLHYCVLQMDSCLLVLMVVDYQYIVETMYKVKCSLK